MRRQQKLPMIADVNGSNGPVLGFRQGGQQQTRKDGNDSDDNQKLDEGERARSMHNVVSAVSRMLSTH
jgi:hypothetical protein